MDAGRRLVDQIVTAYGPTTVEVFELVGSVGLGCTVGPGGPARNSRIVATLGRLCQFGFAHAHVNPDGTALLRVRMARPPLTRRQAARLPEHLLPRLDPA